MDDSGEKATPKPSRGLWAWIVGLLFLCLLLGAPFASAGRIDWVEGWAFLVLVVLGAFCSRAFVKARNPVLLERRRRIGEGTPSWDRLWLGLFRLMWIGLVIVAGLDSVRFGWLSLPAWSCPVGVVLIALGFMLTARSMAENPHFEGTVRIQHDLDHRVIETGPYAIVRHPGYVGISLITLGSPLLLRSGWALVVAAVTVLWIALRTWLEDRLLEAELEGYAKYARKVRSRLIPGGW